MPAGTAPGRPDWVKGLLRPFWRDRITQAELESEMNAAPPTPRHLQRVDDVHRDASMLSTGHPDPVGTRSWARTWPPWSASRARRGRGGEGGTRSASPSVRRGALSPDFVLARDELKRAMACFDDANMMVMTAVRHNQSTTRGKAASARHQRAPRPRLPRTSRPQARTAACPAATASRRPSPTQCFCASARP